MTKMRISKSGEFTKTFPAEVAATIREIAADYGIKSITTRPQTSSKEFIVGEGYRYTGIHSDGRQASFEVVSANTIGAAGLSHAINSRFRMPAGSWLIIVSYYCGYWMEVVQITGEELTDGK